MKPQLLLYSRKTCCLCAEMKAVIGRVAVSMPLALKEVDIDSAPDLRESYGNEVPVLFIDGRKAFKYRVTERQLRSKLARKQGFGKTIAELISRR